MTDQSGAAGTARQLLEARAREMLEHSSDSVASELEHAQGWLRETGFGEPGSYWQVDGIAGGLGALANAWGRLTLWSRGNDTYDSLRPEFEGIMDRLVAMWKRLLYETPAEHDVETLRDILERMRRLRDSALRDEKPNSA